MRYTQVASCKRLAMIYYRDMDNTNAQNNRQINHQRPSIRDLQIDRPGKSERRVQASAEHGGREPQQVSHSAHKRGFSLGWWVLAVVLLISASVISLPIVFSDTTINIKPVVTKAIFTDAVFNAFKASNGTEGESTSDILQYSVVEWDATKAESLEPTGREEVKEKASGIITVYNEYTTSRQRLIKNTRFETADGHVYRVRESIMVPGKTGSTPGTLDVRVYADEAGEGYNTDGGNLTLPGLKSLKDMYTDIYAKVKTPITGGFNGECAVVSEESKALASKKLQDELRATIAEEVQSRIPEDARYFESGVTITFADTSESEVEGKVAVSESASVSVVVFNKRDFAAAMAQGVAGNPSKGYPVVQDMSKLTVAIDMASTDTVDGESIKLVVNGDADFIWNFDQDDLTRDLAGKEREALQTVLAGYPTIKTAEAIIRPFWRSTFPKNAHDFTIEILEVE